MLRFDINIVFAVINLLVLYFILKKFLFGRVDRVLKQRDEMIKKSFEDADKAKAEAQEEKDKAEAERAKLVQSEADVLAQSHAKAAAEYDRIINDASAEADKILDDAHRKAQHDTEISMENAKNQIADMVVNAAGKLTASDGSKDDDRLYALFTEQMKNEAEADTKA